MPDKIPCTVYIDESGDLGINCGTHWFVLTAVIVDKENEPMVRERIQKVRKAINRQEIHFTELRDFYKRSFVVRELSEMPFTYVNIIVDTQKFDQTKIPTPMIAYNYICKYLLERVSWYLTSTNREADVVLSARGTSRDNELIAYITEKLLPYPKNSIDQGSFKKITAKTAANWDLLQLADVCATSTFYAYEVNPYLFTTPCFLKALSDHLLKSFTDDKRIVGYGIKYFNKEMKPNINDLRKHRVCAKKEETPGATTT